MTRLGIHTEVPDPSRPDKTHAWITVEKDGATKTYSLYDNENRRAYDNGQSQGWNGSGTHVRENVDFDKVPTASTFKDITPDQEQKLARSLGQSEKYYTIHNNCSHFASRTWENTTGERLDVKHQAIGSNGRPLPAESPVGLQKSIQDRNTAQTIGKKPEPSWKPEARADVERTRIPDSPQPSPDAPTRSKGRGR